MPVNAGKKSNHGGCWPTREQQLLLKASLLKGDPAISAFKEWRSTADTSAADPGSYRLFPLLHRNLRSMGVNDPLLNIFEWVHRKTKRNTTILLAEVFRLLRKFNSAGIEFILLKGTALILVYYKDPGLRPMMDVDILVRPSQVRDAIRLITGLGWNSSVTPLKGFSAIRRLSLLGWTPKPRAPENFSGDFLLVRHGQDFVDPDRFTIDLHWHALHGYNEADADDPFWQAARRTEIDGLPVSVLSPTDQLLHVCSHGVNWNPIPPIRWIADAVTVIDQAGASIEWGRLTDAAKRHGKALRMRDALGYLKSSLQVAIPEAVIRELAAYPASGSERSEYRIRTRPPGLIDGLVELRFLYDSYSRTNPEQNPLQKMIGFPGFLEHVFGMENARHLMVYTGLEFFRRFGQLLKTGRKRKTV